MREILNHPNIHIPIQKVDNIDLIIFQMLRYNANDLEDDN